MVRRRITKRQMGKKSKKTRARAIDRRAIPKKKARFAGGGLPRIATGRDSASLTALKKLIPDYDTSKVNILLTTSREINLAETLFLCLTRQSAEDTAVKTGTVTYSKAGDQKSTIWLLPIDEYSKIEPSIIGAFDIVIDVIYMARMGEDKSVINTAVRAGRQVISVVNRDICETLGAPESHGMPFHWQFFKNKEPKPEDLSQEQVDKVLSYARARAEEDNVFNHLPSHDFYQVDTQMWRRRLFPAESTRKISVKTEEVAFLQRLREMRDGIWDAIQKYSYS